MQQRAMLLAHLGITREVYGEPRKMKRMARNRLIVTRCLRDKRLILVSGNISTYRRYEASGLLIPHTGSMEKHWASMMMGFMEACRLSVDGSKVSEGGMTGTGSHRDTHLT